MTTFGELVQSISSALHSYTGGHEQTTYLTSAIGASDTTLPVAATEQVRRGVAEIEDELIFVDSTDSSGLALPPFGRGYKGSTAVAHLENTQVTFDPDFPKVEIKRAINQCVAGFFPQLYQIKSTDLTHEELPIGYELPSDVEEVLEVKTMVDATVHNYWAPVHFWSFDPKSPEATGKALNLFNHLPYGGTIRVVYMAKFGEFTDDADTFADVGLEESYADLILYGVTARMVRFLEPSRLQLGSVENLSRAAVVESGAAGRIANQLYATYQTRLLEERNKLLNLTPASIHFQR